MVGPVTKLFASLYFISIGPKSLRHNYSKFDLEKPKVKVKEEVKVLGHVIHSVSNQCISFLFHDKQTNHS